jgi:hypothetical protein
MSVNDEELFTLISARLKTILKESESRLVGGKAFILRHRMWVEDYNIVRYV